MITELIEPFQYPFMQRALIAGVLAALISSVTGIWVVLRGHAFLAEALAHGMLPGIAFAAIVGLHLQIGAALGAIVMVVGIATAGRGNRLGDDTTTGLLLVGMLAVGVIVISRGQHFAVDLDAILFGDILGVTEGDIILQAATLLAVVIVVVVLYRALLALTFDRDSARALGLRPGLAHAATLFLVAAAAVTGFHTVGTLLILALLVAPAATALLVTRSVGGALVLAALLGVVAVTVGLLASFHLDTAGGATIAGVTICVFFSTSVARRLWRHRRAESPAGAP